LLLLPLSLCALALAAACTPPPEPDPTTPWLPAGCLDSEMPGVPDFKFNGVANVANNATAYLDDGVYVEDGSCDGATRETGTIVRAATEADAAAACAALGIVVTAPGNLAQYGYPAPVDAWACASEAEAPGVIEFSGPAQVEVTMFGGTEEEPTETTVPFSGTVSGTWDEATGDFAMGQEIDAGSFAVENSPIGPITVFYTASQPSAATGSFDPATGEGGFQSEVVMTLVGLNGPEGMPQPCDIVSSFDFTGAIDLATGQATVSQDDFTMTPPGDTDCGGLGALIGPMLAGGSNSAVMTFQVFEP
jgi:hypothetical protein